MVGIIIKALVGLVLFAGSLVGGLAATGRLNHEGTANIPVLNALFPAPEPSETEAGDEHGVVDGAHGGADGHVADAVDGVDDHAAVQATLDDVMSDQGQGPPRRRKTGRSVVAPEDPTGGGGHGEEGGAHGEEGTAEADGHGAGDGDGHAAGGDGHADEPHAAGAEDGHDAADGARQNPASRDFDELAELLKSSGRTNYQPGAYFQFDGMPAGLTPGQLNEAWQRVDGILETIAQRETALDLREKQLQELADDISRRLKELGQERLRIEQMQRALDQKIGRFEQTVRLVRDDEVQKLRRYGASLAAFDREIAAELVEKQWLTTGGQDRLLRVFELMDSEAVNEILSLLPNAMVQDVLEKRMTVSKEAAPSAGRD